MSTATARLAQQLSGAMLDQNDPELVRAGAPAYLLLVDAMINDAPHNAALLLTGSRLYGAFAGGLIDDPARRRTLATRALDYARRALCVRDAGLCRVHERPFQEFRRAIAALPDDEVALLYALGTSWAGWIEVHSSDWRALAEVAKAELLLERVAAIDPGYARGRAQLYLGALRSQLPPALGGNPELGRAHFEAAIRYSDGQDLLAKVLFARYYARLVFDRELHDRLLREVETAPAEVSGLTLSNLLAKEQARRLLGDNYF